MQGIISCLVLKCVILCPKNRTLIPCYSLTRSLSVTASGQHRLNDIRGDAGDLKCSDRIWINMAMAMSTCKVLTKRHKCSNYCSIFMKTLKVLSAPLGRMRSQRWCSVGLERLACNQLGQSSVGPGPVSWQHRTSYWPRHYITII